MFEMKIGLPSEGAVSVRTTDRRGFTPEELAWQCVNKLLAVSDTAHPVLRDQAKAFRGDIAKLIELYLKQAVQSDRTTVYNALIDAGHPQLADLIRRL